YGADGSMYKKAVVEMKLFVSSGPPEQFDAWLSSFSLEEKKAEISELLVSSPSIRALYTKMVPAAVAHSEFWQRYFYKVFQLDQEEARRVALKRRAEETTQSESLGWEEDEEDEFLGGTSTSRLDFTPPLEESQLPTVTIETPCEPAVSPVDAASDVTPSVSSDSVSLPTQLENNPEQPVSSNRPAPAEEVTLKLSEARLEKVVDKQAGPEQTPAENSTARVEQTREEGPQDLRVFELNSDSGKSTPSNNGKKGSSTDVSEDWEKDFDLDMTEEEVQLALAKADATAESCVVQPSADGAALTGGLMEDTTAHWRSVVVVLGQSGTEIRPALAYLTCAAECGTGIISVPHTKFDSCWLTPSGLCPVRCIRGSPPVDGGDGFIKEKRNPENKSGEELETGCLHTLQKTMGKREV
ncbi:hypothetical protein NFI96_030782, partial [Prochilodus magdalenae]